MVIMVYSAYGVKSIPGIEATTSRDVLHEIIAGVSQGRLSLSD